MTTKAKKGAFNLYHSQRWNRAPTHADRILLIAGAIDAAVAEAVEAEQEAFIQIVEQTVMSLPHAGTITEAAQWAMAKIILAATRARAAASASAEEEA